MSFDESSHPDLRAINALGIHRDMGGCDECRTIEGDNMTMDFIPPEPQNAEPTRALAEHLSYGMVATLDGRQVFVLEPHECRQLLYELTDDKRWIED